MDRFRWMFLLAALLLPVAVVGSQQQVTLAAEEFTVVRGSTMWDLAGEKCGDSRRWAEIFEINVLAGLLPDQRLSYNAAGEPIVLLRPGERILIPTVGCQRASALVELVPTVANDSALIAELAALRAAIANQPSFHWLWLAALISVLLLIAAAVWYGLRRLTRQIQLNGAALPGLVDQLRQALPLTPGTPTPIHHETGTTRLVTIEVGGGRTEVRVGDDVMLPIVGHETTVAVRGGVTYVAREDDDGLISVDSHGRIRAVARQRVPDLVVVSLGQRSPSADQRVGEDSVRETEEMAAPAARSNGTASDPELSAFVAGPGARPSAPDLDWEGEVQQREKFGH